MLSVVIATLGGPELAHTIATLNHGSVQPDEILICLPCGADPGAVNISENHVSILICQSKGQVSQRAEGFANVRGDYVLQLDDDIELDFACVERLRYMIDTMPGRVAVAPLMLDRDSGQSVYKRENTVWRRIFFFLLNGRDGYQPGKVAKSGFGMGVERSAIPGDALEVDWIPGGCILHKRENLILQNFFPFSGKAFSEDLMHSAELSHMGVSLYMVAAAKCRLESALVSPKTLSDAFSELRTEFKACSHYLKRYRTPSFRILFYAAVRTIFLTVGLIRFKAKLTGPL